MEDEGNGLHDPWAPPPPTSEELGADVPTRVTPIEPPPPIAPVDIPPEPAPQPEPATRRRWPGSAKAAVAILAVVLIATAAGLGYAWWKTNDEKKDLENASNQQGQELSQQLDQANQQLAASKQQLDQANAQVADLQGKLNATQNDATAAQQQAQAMSALFPLTPQKVQPGLPGTYRTDPVSAATGGCSLAACPSAQLTLTIESSGGGLTVSDPALGRVPLQAVGAGWSATGPASAALQLQCNGAPQPTTFTLSLSASTVALDAKDAPQVATLAGGLLLSSPAVAATAEPPVAGCPPGVGAYSFAANRT